MDIIDFLRQYQKQYGGYPTERQMAAIGSRMEGGQVKMNIDPSLPSSVYGEVDPLKPNEMKLNPSGFFRKNYEPVIHELEHIDQLSRGQGSKTKGLDIRWGIIPKMDNSPFLEKGTPSVYPVQTDEFQKDFPEVFTASNSANHQMEAFANIANYESTLPIGVSLRDTPLGKKLKEMGILEQVMAMIGGRQFSEFSEKPKETKVNPKASYARQALQYLGFKDPFEDTTKD